MSVSPAAAPAHPASVDPVGLLAALGRAPTGRTVAIAKAGDVAGDLAVNFAIALGILVATVWISAWAARGVRAALREIPRTDETLADFLGDLARYLVVIVGLIAVLHRLGVETTSIIAVLGAASLAIGLALQGALSNVAAGVMILLFRPYRVGDTATLAGKTGTIRRLDLFNTELSDENGLKVVVPNAKAFGDVVVNYTDIPNRRIELSFRIPYDEDADRALEALRAAAAADPRLMGSPAPWAKITDLQPDAVVATLRVWAGLDGFWDVRCDLLKAARDALVRAGVTTAYPVTLAVPDPRDPAGPPAALRPS